MFIISACCFQLLDYAYENLIELPAWFSFFLLCFDVIFEKTATSVTKTWSKNHPLLRVWGHQVPHDVWDLCGEKTPMKPILCGQESSRRAAEISIVFSPECEHWVDTVELHSLNKALQVNWMPELPRLQSVLLCACFNRETPWGMLLLPPLEWAVGTIRELGWRGL